MNTKKIVVTGMGAITPIGCSINEYWKNLISGKRGISEITRFDTSDISVKVAAEIHDFHPEDVLPKKVIKETDLFMQYAMFAAEEALLQSKLPIKPFRTGIVMGTAMNGITTIADTQDGLSTGLHKKVSPRFLPKILGNIAASQLAIWKGIQGPSLTLNTACSSGGDAISTAALLLKAGEADSVIAVGAEAILCPLTVKGLAGARALSANPNPLLACRPFDKERDGFVMGEGGGALVLETEEHALQRGANILAELCGYSNNTDGYHVTSPDPSGSGAIHCMKRAIEMAGLTLSEIGYINAHGTSTKMGDAIESDAIQTLFGDSTPPVSSTKAATGHLMGAGGITETITCIKAIETGMIPATLNYQTPDPDCNLDYVPNIARKEKIQTAMSNAFGFGGQNSSILVGKYNF